MNKFLKQEWPLLTILLLTFLAAAAIYPVMPDRVPIHWNAAGQVDGYGSRAFGTFFLPVMNLGMYVLFLVLPKFDPRKENYAKFSDAYRFIRYTFHLFLIYMFAITLLASLGYGVSIDRLVPIGVALLFIVLGNYMGKIRHNYFVGFRFPWTLANEEVWKKTHQFGAKAMVIGGILALLSVLAPDGTLRFPLFMICIFVPMIITGLYSYLIYQRLRKDQQ